MAVKCSYPPTLLFGSSFFFGSAASTLHISALATRHRDCNKVASATNTVVTNSTLVAWCGAWAVDLERDVEGGSWRAYLYLKRGLLWEEILDGNQKSCWSYFTAKINNTSPFLWQSTTMQLSRLKRQHWRWALCQNVAPSLLLFAKLNLNHRPQKRNILPELGHGHGVWGRVYSWARRQLSIAPAWGAAVAKSKMPLGRTEAGQGSQGRWLRKK